MQFVGCCHRFSLTHIYAHMNTYTCVKNVDFLVVMLANIYGIILVLYTHSSFICCCSILVLLCRYHICADAVWMKRGVTWPDHHTFLQHRRGPLRTQYGQGERIRLRQTSLIRVLRLSHFEKVFSHCLTP